MFYALFLNQKSPSYQNWEDIQLRPSIQQTFQFSDNQYIDYLEIDTQNRLIIILKRAQLQITITSPNIVLVKALETSSTNVCYY